MGRRYWLLDWRGSVLLYLVGFGMGLMVSSGVCGDSRSLALVGLTLATIGTMGLLEVRPESVDEGDLEKRGRHEP